MCGREGVRRYDVALDKMHMTLFQINSMTQMIKKSISQTVYNAFCFTAPKNQASLEAVNSRRRIGRQWLIVRNVEEVHL